MRPGRRHSPIPGFPAEWSARGPRAWIGFLLACAGYWLVALLVVSAIPAIERAGIAMTLDSVNGLLALLGQKVLREGDVIGAGTVRVRIVSDCSPHLPMLLYAGVVLAFPAAWKLRAFGLVFGALLITLFNTIRVVALIGILIAAPRSFEFAHVYLWQTGTLLVVLATFLLWIKVAFRRAPEPSTG